MRFAISASAALLGLMLSGNAQAEPSRADQARTNYEALLNGRKQLNQLTPQELADIAALDKALRGEPDTRTPSQRCVDREVKRVGSAPSDLEQQVIGMKCRALGQGM